MNKSPLTELAVAAPAAPQSKRYDAAFKQAAVKNWLKSRKPGTVVQSAQTTAASTTFDNLTPGVVYNIEANAVTTAGTSDWSNPVSQMVV